MNTQAADKKTKICLSCAEEINSNADKCNKCGTFQTWRRHLQFSATILSLLIALISVSAIVFTNVAKHFEKTEALVTVEPVLATINLWRTETDNGVQIRAASSDARLLFINEGNRPGTIRSIKLEIRLNPKPIIFTYDLATLGVVHPNKPFSETLIMIPESHSLHLTQEEYQNILDENDIYLIVDNGQGNSDTEPDRKQIHPDSLVIVPRD